MKSIIMHGPRACGKTFNSKKIARGLRLSRVFDGWSPADGQPPMLNTLVITNVIPKEHETFGLRVLHFRDAAKEAHVKIPNAKPLIEML